MRSFDWFPGKGGLKPNGSLRTMEDWKAYVDGLSRHERDRLYPGMHKDLIPAYEVVMAKGLGGSGEVVAGDLVDVSKGLPGNPDNLAAGVLPASSFAEEYGNVGSVSSRPPPQPDTTRNPVDDDDPRRPPTISDPIGVTVRDGTPWSMDVSFTGDFQMGVYFTPSSASDKTQYGLTVEYLESSTGNTRGKEATTQSPMTSFGGWPLEPEDESEGPVFETTSPEIEDMIIWKLSDHQGYAGNVLPVHSNGIPNRQIRYTIAPKKKWFKGALELKFT